jgi:hypothetical protein
LLPRPSDPLSRVDFDLEKQHQRRVVGRDAARGPSSLHVTRIKNSDHPKKKSRRFAVRLQVCHPVEAGYSGEPDAVATSPAARVSAPSVGTKYRQREQ